MRSATLCFLLKENEVLLGMKKKGFGEGKWNGFGGKVEQGESIEAAAVREMREESGVLARGIRKHAELTFIFPKKPEWDQVVHVFVAKEWEGEPVESDEMAPRWFAHKDIPFKSMWVDDKHWLPLVLEGRFVRGTFRFDGDDLLDFEVKTDE
ncbi:8-oxo-dGTP diphosphatase [Candidatus Woesearchaeota archaeon]|nr:MAG: 8-oxo-dGTP diphosphatase [Candidatus Woesearchaeota archaeon]